LRETIYKEERFILAHSFRGFSPSSAGSIALSLRQGRPWQQDSAAEPAHFMANQEAQRKGRVRDKIPFKDTPQVTYFLQVGPIS
jgi:hypothetical protein